GLSWVNGLTGCGKRLAGQQPGKHDVLLGDTYLRIGGLGGSLPADVSSRGAVTLSQVIPGAGGLILVVSGLVAGVADRAVGITGLVAGVAGLVLGVAYLGSGLLSGGLTRLTGAARDGTGIG